MAGEKGVGGNLATEAASQVYRFQTGTAVAQAAEVGVAGGGESLALQDDVGGNGLAFSGEFLHRAHHLCGGRFAEEKEEREEKMFLHGNQKMCSNHNSLLIP